VVAHAHHLARFDSALSTTSSLAGSATGSRIDGDSAAGILNDVRAHNFDEACQGNQEILPPSQHGKTSKPLVKKKRWQNNSSAKDRKDRILDYADFVTINMHYS
jgi:hypothetical protein